MTPVPPDTPPHPPTPPKKPIIIIIIIINVPRKSSSVVASETLCHFLCCVWHFVAMLQTVMQLVWPETKKHVFFFWLGDLRFCRNPVFTTGARESPKRLGLASRKLEWWDGWEESRDFFFFFWVGWGGGGGFYGGAFKVGRRHARERGVVGGGRHLIGQESQVSFTFSLSNPCWQFDLKILFTSETVVILFLVSPYRFLWKKKNFWEFFQISFHWHFRLRKSFYCALISISWRAAVSCL